MKALYIIPSLFFLLITSANAKTHQVLRGHWTLQIENPQHKVVTTLAIHFMEDKAQSCLAGNWQQILVDSYQTTDPQFFPASGPLSYEFNGNKLSIGFNEICDAYLQLSGTLQESMVSGEYVSFGWGHRKLGYFSLRRSTKQ